MNKVVKITDLDNKYKTKYIMLRRYNGIINYYYKYSVSTKIYEREDKERGQRRFKVKKDRFEEYPKTHIKNWREVTSQDKSFIRDRLNECLKEE